MNKKFLIAWLVMFVLYFAFGFIVHWRPAAAPTTRQRDLMRTGANSNRE